jgi:polyisoprenoid-binding protein YceI
MRRIALALILLTCCTAIEGKSYRFEPVNGTVSFSVMKWGVFREEGVFRDFTATIAFDPKNAAASRVDFVIDTDSIDTKNDGRDSTLRSPDFLDVSRHPRMTFRSVRVVPTGKQTANVTGDLTIRGVTRRITVPVRLTGMVSRNGKPDLAAFETTFKIDRRDFGVNGSRWSSGAPGVLGTEVDIRIVAGAVEADQ